MTLSFDISPNYSLMGAPCNPICIYISVTLSNKKIAKVFQVSPAKFKMAAVGLATCLVNGLCMHEGYQGNAASLCLPNG